MVARLIVVLGTLSLPFLCHLESAASLLPVVAVTVSAVAFMSGQRKMAVAPLVVAGLVAGEIVLDLPALRWWYPVFVNLFLAISFFASLFLEQSVVEQVARKFETKGEPLTAFQRKYCRWVVLYWIGFFMANASVTVWAIAGERYEFWLWYNGLLAYCLVVVAFCAELLVRTITKRLVTE